MAYTSLLLPDVDRTSSRDRAVRIAATLTAAVAYAGVALQLWVNVVGDANGYGPLGETLHLMSYFTITSNLVVAVVSTLLALDPARAGRWFDVLRLAALVMISVTGIVYWLLLHGDPQAGAAWVANMLTHTVVPLAAVGSWLFVGPHGRFGWRLVPLMLVIPVAWLVHALIRGAVSGYYAYDFIDVAALGYAAAGLNILGVVALALVLASLFVGVDALIGRFVTRDRP